MVILTIEQLQEALVWWRSYFGLSDWEINIQMAHGGDIGAVARSRTRIFHKEADIEIATVETRTERARGVCDMEIDLLHELLHVVWCPAETAANLKQDSVENDLIFEQPVEMLARSMVRLRRQAGPKFSWEQPSHGLEHCIE